jgi:hypothetical protein
MDEMRNTYTILVGTLKETDYLGGLIVDGRIFK